MKTMTHVRRFTILNMITAKLKKIYSDIHFSYKTKRPCHGFGCYSPSPHLGGPGSFSRPFHMAFVVDQVELGQVFLRVLPFSPVSTISPTIPWTASFNDT
jgi:hypothetical protein